MREGVRLIQGLCLGAVLALAAGIGCAAAVIAGYGFYDEVMDARVRDSIDGSWESLVVLSDGRAVIAVTDRLGDITYLQTNREPMFPEREAWMLPPIPVLFGADLPAEPPPVLPLGARLQSRVLFVGEVQPDVDWYFLYEHESPGRAWFEGFDSGTGRRVGFIGREGFSGDPLAPQECFAVNGLTMARSVDRVLLEWEQFLRNYGDHNRGDIAFEGEYPIGRRSVLLLSDGDVHLVDLEQRTIRTLDVGAPALSFDALGWLRPAVVAEDEAANGEARQERFTLHQELAVRTAERIVLLNPQAGTRREYVIPEAFRGRSLFFLPADGTAVVQSYVEGSSRETGPGQGAYGVDLAWITSEGDVARRERVTLHQSRGLSHLSERGQKNLAILAVPAPLVSGVLVGLVPWLDARMEEVPYAERLRTFLWEVWPGLFVVGLLSVGLAWLADRKRRAHHLPPSLAWGAFVLLLGLPGYASYILHRRWPVRNVPGPAERTGAEIIVNP